MLTAAAARGCGHKKTPVGCCRPTGESQGDTHLLRLWNTMHQSSQGPVPDVFY